MSFDRKDDKLKTAWIWIAFIIAILGAILFTTYGMMLGSISHDHAAWSSFGSLLSGFFMVASTGATVATLLFLAHQNRQIQKTNEDQQKVTQQQLAAMNFEQYINHRRLFMDRLRELENSFENKFVFVDGENLYNWIFPLNSPVHLDFKVEPVSTAERENLLGRLQARLKRLDEFLDQATWDYSGTRDVITLIMHINGDLGIRWTGEVFDGDMRLLGFQTGINIYSLDEFLRIAKVIASAFLFYSGNPRFEGLNKSLMRYSREALMEFFLDRRDYRDALEVVKVIPGLEVIERLYFDIDRLRAADHSWILKNTYSTLLEVFRSRNDVIKLRDRAFYESFVSIGCNETALGLSNMSADDEDYALMKRCHEDFNHLLTLGL